MFDLLIKGGVVVDPTQALHERRDVAVTGGRVAVCEPEISISEAARVIDARDKLVLPGLIDLHAHVAHGVIELGAPPDAAGVLRGVTTVCDAGSVGPANLEDFRTRVVSGAQTDVLCFVHIARTGLARMPEIASWEDIDAPRALEAILRNRDIVRGVKMRAIAAVAQGPGIAAIKMALSVARQADAPLMVHIGDGLAGSAAGLMDSFTGQVLSLLDRGDIISHVYTSQPGAAIKPDGTVMPELLGAKSRGVILDTAHGRPNLSFAVARKGLAEGILPTTISTDLASTNIGGPIYSLLLTMSKFLALGLSLEQVVKATTAAPAQALGQQGKKGTLRPGVQADISIVETLSGSYRFADGVMGNSVQGDTLLIPHLTVKRGLVVPPAPGAELEIG